MSSMYVFTRKCGSPETRIGEALIHRQLIGFLLEQN